MRIDAIAIGHNPPEDVNVIIEVPIGGEPIKYEMDKAAGTLVVDRFLHTPMRYPGNYGFVPHTLSDDGDPIDVLVANTRPIVPGAVMNVRPIGVLMMEDDAGGDEKIIAVPSPKLTKRYENVMNYTRPAADHARADPALLRALQGSRARQMGEAAGWGDADEARRLIREAIARAKDERVEFALCWSHPTRFCWRLRMPTSIRRGRGSRLARRWPGEDAGSIAVADSWGIPARAPLGREAGCDGFSNRTK